MNSRRTSLRTAAGKRRFDRPAVFALVAALPLLLIACASPRPSAQSQRPNIVFILVDDLGWSDVGSYGSSFYETPHIDRLAEEGMQFSDAYAAAAICSPTRSSILTGKYPARLHQTDWIPGQGNARENRLLQVEDLNYLPLGEVTLAERLKAAGYRTAHVGKWHLGDEGRLPTDQGFDVNVAGTHRGSPPSYFWPYRREEYQLEELAETGQAGEYLTDRLTDEAIRFIETNSDAPFFLHLSYYAVHLPLEGKADLVERYRSKPPTDASPETLQEEGLIRRVAQSNPAYAAMVETVDINVGRLLLALEDQGIADETLVVFTSDNGGLSVWTSDRSGVPPTHNRSLHAGKGWLYEGGIRVPLIVKWPGVTVPGSRSGVPVSSIDFYPTLVEAAGIPAAAGAAVDGMSLMPLLRQAGDLGREALYWHYPHYHGSGAGPASAVRHGDYKLIEFLEDGRLELYNIREDLAETEDLAGSLPDRAQELRGMLYAWRNSVDAQMPEPNPEWHGSMDP